MNIRTFNDAGWHKSALMKLEVNSCEGLEITLVNQEFSVSKKEAFELIRDILRHSFPALKTWVITGHTADQENTPLAHFRKFIKGHGISLKPYLLEDVFEWHITDSHGLRYFAIIKSELISDEAIFRLFDSEKSTWLVAAENSYTASALSGLFNQGWVVEDFPLSDQLLKTINSKNLFFAKTFAAPESNEAGAILIGKIDFLKKFFL